MPKKLTKLLRAAAEYFSAGAGAIAFIFGLLATAVLIPFVITIPVTVGIGIAFAIWGVRDTWRKIKTQEAEDNAIKAERESQKRSMDNSLEIIKGLDKKMDAVTNLEHKIEDVLQHGGDTPFMFMQQLGIASPQQATASSQTPTFFGPGASASSTTRKLEHESATRDLAAPRS